MPKLFLHVGFAKCGSTSLQDALKVAPHIYYPRSGVNGSEHLGLALKIRGIDDWTRQFFDETWVNQQNTALQLELKNKKNEPIVLSSERLAAMSEQEISSIKTMLASFQVELVIVKRQRDAYLKSTWRHAVFYHDYALSYEEFYSKMGNFSFDGAIEKFKKHFLVHVFDLDDPDYEKHLNHLLGTKITLPKSNVGVPSGFASLLQQTHALMGSQKFKSVYDMPTKQSMLSAFHGSVKHSIDPIDAPLF